MRVVDAAQRGTRKRMKMYDCGGDAAYSAVVAYGYEGRMRRPYMRDRSSFAKATEDK